MPDEFRDERLAFWKCCLLCLFLSGSLVAVTGCRKKSATVPKVDREQVEGIIASPSCVELGSVAPDTVKKVHFDLQNRGERVVRIQRVLPDCGCAQVQLPGTSMPPGGSIPLEVSIDTSKITAAEFQKRIVVQIADESGGQLGSLLLEVKGQIDHSRSLAVFPNRLDFGDLYPGTHTERTLYVRGSISVLKQLPDRLILNPNSPTTLTVEVKDADPTISNKAITISYAPLQATVSGRFCSPVSLAVSGCLQWHGEIEAIGILRPRLRAEPSRLLLLAGPSDPVTIRLVGPPNAPLRLCQVTVSGPLAWREIERADGIGIQIWSQGQAVSSLPMVGEVTARAFVDGALESIRIPVTVASIMEREAVPDAKYDESKERKDDVR